MPDGPGWKDIAQPEAFFKADYYAFVDQLLGMVLSSGLKSKKVDGVKGADGKPAILET